MKRALVLSLLISCAAKQAPPTANAIEIPPLPPAASASALPPPDPPPPPTPPRLVFEQCVLHAGGGNRSMKKTKVGDGGFTESTQGSCWYGAECVREPGNAKPGDGFVGVKCENTHCTCSLRSATTEEKREEAFDIDEICASADVAKKLLIERCMAGMPRPK